MSVLKNVEVSDGRKGKEFAGGQQNDLRVAAAFLDWPEEARKQVLLSRAKKRHRANLGTVANYSLAMTNGLLTQLS